MVDLWDNSCGKGLFYIQNHRAGQSVLSIGKCPLLTPLHVHQNKMFLLNHLFIFCETENPVHAWLKMDTRTREKHLKHMKICILAPVLFGKRMNYSSKVHVLAIQLSMEHKISAEVQNKTLHVHVHCMFFFVCVVGFILIPLFFIRTSDG